MELDPVDTWEMSRNDLVQQVQGNRNVFIDHPELAYAMFGRTAPDNIAIGKAEQKEYGSQDGDKKSGSDDKNNGEKNTDIEKNTDDDKNSDGGKNTDPRATVTKKTLTVGQNPFQIKISYRAKDAVVTYKSSNKKIAKVTKAGKIKAVAEGKATITVTVKQNGKTYKSKIAVTVKPRQ
ncbi:MAG: Ig-like domain-containing protein [Lachnospiraceae bacterium]|nr:Ig-like domain-containing protein [Lachnospiraceae bacterium]